MKRAFKVFAVAAAGLAVAMLAPVQAWAACPGGVPINQCASGIVLVSPGATAVGGTFWIAGGGLDITGPGDTTPGFGNDAGVLAGFPVDPTPGSGWAVDFLGDNTTRCVFWDWSAGGIDGCGDGFTGNAMVTVLRDDKNNYAILQVAPGGGVYDYDLITNGGASPFGGTNNGVTLARAVRVTNSADVAGKVQLNVGPLTENSFFDITRPLPGTPRLKGVLNGSPTLVAGGGGGSITVDPETDLCWELVDGGYTATLGCVRVGTSNASQSVANGKADFNKGGANFSWDVTAQFDVMGFNIYQKNVTKGTERKVNETLIPISGENDATPESYTYTARRNDLRAVKGGFEIELVRQNGETSRAPVSVTR